MNLQPIAILCYKNGKRVVIDDLVYFNRWLKCTTRKWVCENPDSMDAKIFKEIQEKIWKKTTKINMKGWFVN